jgi:hypothetical protein
VKRERRAKRPSPGVFRDRVRKFLQKDLSR